jgi:hypothetical protein
VRLNIKKFDTLNLIRIIVILNTRIMTTKLTLTIDDSVIKVAKKYAKNTGKSLSGIVERIACQKSTNYETYIFRHQCTHRLFGRQKTIFSRGSKTFQLFF